MKTPTALLSGLTSLFGLSLLLAGCSLEGSEGGSAGEMSIQSCSLGCSIVIGNQITCSVENISQNQEVMIQFSESVDLLSVTAGSFRLQNLTDGTVPSGVFTVDPSDSRRLIFRPTLTFTGPGNPEFGFDVNETYEIRVLGEEQDPDGPFIRSMAGKNNQTRMSCVVQTSEDLNDPVPGAPTMTGYVTDQLDPSNGSVLFDPATNLPVGGLALNGAAGLDTAARVVLIFDDVMNLATIANQLNGQSNTIYVWIDVDGDINTDQDRVSKAGAWTVDVDFDNLLRTVAIFTPSGGEFPTGGGDPNNPRLVLVEVTNQLLDLVNNPVENDGLWDEDGGGLISAFSTIIQTFSEELLTEDFTASTMEDPRTSGASWGGGRLTYGSGGGTGRLGPLVLTSGQLTLNTDSQVFPLPGQVHGLLTNLQPSDQPGSGDYDPTDRATWPTITIDQFGQAFEFTRVEISNLAELILTGTQPGRIFSRGEILHNGLINLTGDTPAAHKSNSGGTQNNNLKDGLETLDGGPGGFAGPAAGVGGQGADRMDMGEPGVHLPVMENIGGIIYPPGHAPAVNDGRDGGGVGGLPTGTGGKGGSRYPGTLPKYYDPVHADYGDAELSVIADDFDSPPDKCRIAMIAGPGSGGSHAFMGTVGIPMSSFVAVYPGLISNIPTATPGGDNSNLNLEPPGSPASPENQRNLDFWRKHLRGGSGGGGGGTHIYASRRNGAEGPNCDSGGGLSPFWDHSAAGGGGGGGAVMLVAGGRLRINGAIDCSGGGGGSSTEPGAVISLCTQSGQVPSLEPDCDKYASPGGAGAGGAVRLQGDVVEFAATPGRVVVEGGLGGLGVENSIGGDGSPGLVRVEYNGFVDQISDALVYAPWVSPYDPAAGSGAGELNEYSLSGGILSIGEWEGQTLRPESYCGSQSCWLEVPTTQGAFFSLSFVDDTAGAPTELSNFGWNMDVIYDHLGRGELIFPYRGIPPVDAGDQYDEDFYPPELGGDDFQTYFGNSLNHDEVVLSEGSLFAIRFQGLRLTGVPADLCDLDLESPAVEPGSVTTWVDHPAKLNLFLPQPNVIRFVVVFDEQLAAYDPTIAERIRGVTNLRIRIQPN